MATNNSAFHTYLSPQKTGNTREDLTSIMDNLTPWDTPIKASAGSCQVKGVLHEWQIKESRSAGANAHIEGADAPAPTSNASQRLGNYVQNFQESYAVTGTQKAAQLAAGGSQLAMERAEKMNLISQDIEYALCNNGVKSAGGTTGASPNVVPNAARTLGSIQSYVKNYDSDGSTVITTAGDGSNVGTAASSSALTEEEFTNVLQTIWTDGGNPDKVFVPPTLKRQISKGWKGRASDVSVAATDKTIQTVVDIFLTDFGTVSIHASRIMPTDEIIILDSSRFNFGYYRPLEEKPLAPTGDADKFMLVCEATSEVINPKAHGVIKGVTGITPTA